MKTFLIEGGGREMEILVQIFAQFSHERRRALLRSGILNDLGWGNIAAVDRNAFRQALQLPPLEHWIPIPASMQPFVARRKFVVALHSYAKVKISHVGEQFKRIYEGTIEPPQPASSLRFHALSQGLVHNQITNEISHQEADVETSLYEMFFLLSQQGTGEEGVLLSDGAVNIFCIPNGKSVTWTVRVYWDGRGWNIEPLYVDDIYRWRDGGRIFFRKLQRQ